MTVKISAIVNGKKIGLAIECDDKEQAKAMKNAVLATFAGWCLTLTFLEVSEG